MSNPMRFMIVLILGFLCSTAAAQPKAEPAIEPAAPAIQPFSPVSLSSQSSSNPITIDLPVLDTPFMVTNGEFGFPSMRQSLEYSTSFYQTAHSLLGGTPKQEHRSWNLWAILGFDVVTTYFPLGTSWLHEEWHRATLTRRGIESFNDVYKIPIGSEVIAVSHVGDEALSNFKRDHPSEFVRMSSAGMESQIAQNYAIEKRHFFQGTETFDVILLGINAISVTSYLATCSSGEADTSTDKQNRNDGSDIPRRDFTGLDCTAWAYDLFRPSEAYSARGVHPSGTGIDRYIKHSDLAPHEKSYLNDQVWLSTLNIVDPFMWGFDRFSANIFGRDAQWNARMGHTLTSFGHTVDTSLFLKISGEGFLLTVHNGFNAARYFPGLTLEWIDHPLSGEKYKLSSKFTVWNQPESQSVRADQASMLVSAGSEISYLWGERKSVYLGIDAKTPGWLQGNVYLDRNLSLFSGLRIGLF